MNYEQRLQEEIIYHLNQWDDKQIFEFFKDRIEQIVINKRVELIKELKKCWKNKSKYTYRDTGECVNDDMSTYFSPKQLNKLSIMELDKIISSINIELNFNN